MVVIRNTPLILILILFLELIRIFLLLARIFVTGWFL